jgi:hypothetical protein
MGPQLPFELFLALLICAVGIGAAAWAARRRRSFERAIAAADLDALERLARAATGKTRVASRDGLGSALRTLLAPVPTPDLVHLGNGAVASDAPVARLVFSTVYGLLVERRRGADRELLRRQRWPELAMSFILEAGPSCSAGDRET